MQLLNTRGALGGGAKVDVPGSEVFGHAQAVGTAEDDSALAVVDPNLR